MDESIASRTVKLLEPAPIRHELHDLRLSLILWRLRRLPTRCGNRPRRPASLRQRSLRSRIVGRPRQPSEREGGLPIARLSIPAAACSLPPQYSRGPAPIVLLKAALNALSDS